MVGRGRRGRAPLFAPALDARPEIHQLLKQAEFDYQRLQYNTVVSAAMKMLNALDAALPDSADEANHAVMRVGWSILLRVQYPVVPHISTALWLRLGFSAASGGALLHAPWPEIDSSALAAAEIDLVLQINGNARGMLRVAQDAARSAIEQAALEHELFARFDQGKPPRKIVVVPGRLVNIVV